MDSFSICLSGLEVSKHALDIIGNNVANAATPGYHRQRADLSPHILTYMNGSIQGGGVDFDGLSRHIDIFLEMEILRQQSVLGEVSTELSTLKTIETTFGELYGSSGLNAIMDGFFNSLRELSAHPGEGIYQNQVIANAESMASQFRILGGTLTDLQTKVYFQAESTIDEINILFEQIAKLNGEIQNIELGGGQAPNLRDQRDQLIYELSNLINISTNEVDNGVVNILAASIPVVTGTEHIDLEVSLTSDNALGVSIAGASNFSTSIEGGKLGALFSLHNETVEQISDDLDSLALEIIQQMNQIHVQGVGSYGSFEELTGWTMPDEDLADFDPPISDGSFYIRVIDTSTGQITRNEINVDVSADSLSTIAAAISAVNGLNASASSSQIRILADADYEFDFIPALLPSPTNSNLTAGSPPEVTVSGIYDGASNQTYTFTVSGTGSVGNGTLLIEARDGAGELVATLNVGAGYAAGDKLSVENGIEIALTTGDLNDGDTFEIDAFESTDTSGFLAAVGLNTFFSGSNASNMMVCETISNAPERTATSLGPDMTDNTNVTRMIDLQETSMSGLNSLTFNDFYLKMVTDLGQEITLAQMREDHSQTLMLNLMNQREQISGVDINDEAARMMIFEQMFQAMSKYLDVVQTSLFTLMDVI